MNRCKEESVKLDCPSTEVIQQTERLYECDLIRTILTVLVVVGHSTYYTISTQFGGLDMTSVMAQAGIQDTMLHWVTSKITGAIYLFHMPAFFALSGYLLEWKFESNVLPQTKKFIQQKASRLLIPLVAVWLLWNIPIKMLSGYYQEQEFPVVSALTQIIFSDSVYLWFLEALFCAYVLLFLIKKYTTKQIESCVCLCSFVCGLILQKVLGQWMPLGNPLKYIFWLWVGCLLYRGRNVLLTQKSRKMILLSSTILFIIAAPFHSFGYVGDVIRHGICPLFATISLFSFCAALADIIDRQGKFVRLKACVNFMNKYSFGIYLYAEPLNYLLLSLTLVVFGAHAFGSEWMAAGLYAIRICGTTLVAIAIVWVLKKVNPKTYLC